MAKNGCRGYRMVVGRGLCAAFVTLHASAGTPSLGARTHGDTRLDRRVQTSQREGSLASYLKQVTADTGVSQLVVKEFAERPLVALDIDARLGALQQAMGETYQLSWQASTGAPHAYRLYESRSDRDARARERAEARAAGHRRMTERREEVGRLAHLSEAELRRLAAAGDGKARALLHPHGMAAQRLSEQLPETAWAQLWARGEARVPVAALGADAQALARAALGTKRLRGEDGAEYRSDDLLLTEGQVKLQIGGTADRPTVWQMINARYFGTTANLLYAEAGSRQPPGERRAERSAAARRSRVPNDARFRKRVSLRDRERAKTLYPGDRPSGARPLAEYLEQLAAQLDLPLLAECEYKPKDKRWLDQQWWLAEDINELPLAEALDLLCADFECEWELRHGFLVLRPRLWYLTAEERKPIEPSPR